MASQLHDEGVLDILKAYFQSVAEPVTLYAGLGNGSRPTADTATLAASVTEVTGTGYARQSLATDSTDWPTVQLESSEGAATSKQVTFTCSSGTWSTYNYVFLCTVSSGTSGLLIATFDVTTPRALAATESYKPTLRIGLD